MEPFAQPSDKSSQELEDILREVAAGRPVRAPLPAAPPSGTDAPPATGVTAPGADLAIVPRLPKAASEIRYDVESRLQESGHSTPSGIRLTSAGVMAAVLGLVAVAVWGWLIIGWTAAPATSFAATYTDASERWAIGLTSGRIEQFRREFHDTPNTLEPIGRPVSDLITYKRMSRDRYVLSMPTANGALTYDSIRPLQGFLGGSGKTLGLSALESQP